MILQKFHIIIKEINFKLSYSCDENNNERYFCVKKLFPCGVEDNNSTIIIQIIRYCAGINNVTSFLNYSTANFTETRVYSYGWKFKY